METKKKILNCRHGSFLGIAPFEGFHLVSCELKDSLSLVLWKLKGSKSISIPFSYTAKMKFQSRVQNQECYQLIKKK